MSAQLSQAIKLAQLTYFCPSNILLIIFFLQCIHDAFIQSNLEKLYCIVLLFYNYLYHSYFKEVSGYNKFWSLKAMLCLKPYTGCNF